MDRKKSLPGAIALPLVLTFLRLVLGPVAFLVALNGGSQLWFVPILVCGILSDYFDGVLARRFKVAFPWVRRFDSVTDVVFYGCILVCGWIVARATIVAAAVPVMVVVVGEMVVYAAGLVKFRALPAVHAISAKIYGLCFFVACLGVISFGAGAWMLWVLGGVSIVANVEILVVLLVSKEAPVDVLSVFHLRRQMGVPARGRSNPQTRRAVLRFG